MSQYTFPKSNAIAYEQTYFSKIKVMPGYSTSIWAYTLQIYLNMTNGSKPSKFTQIWHVYVAQIYKKPESWVTVLHAG